MRPVKYVYATATLAFAFVSPRIARFLVTAVLAILGVIVIWAAREPAVMVGMVDEVVRLDNVSATLVAITPPFGDPLALKITDPVLAGRTLDSPDLVIVFGAMVDMAEPGLRPDGFFEVSRVGILPVSDLLNQLDATALREEIARTNKWGVVLIAGLLAVFSHTALRAGAAALFGAVSALTTFLLLHINAESAFLPVPQELFGPLILAGGIGGGAIAFKAALHDPAHLGERLAAAVLALPLALLLPAAGLMPEPIAWTLPLLALPFPALTPVSAAMLVLNQGLDLDMQSSWLSFAGMLVLAWLFRRRWADPGKRSLRASHQRFRPDNSGHIDIDQLLTSED